MRFRVKLQIENTLCPKCGEQTSLIISSLVFPGVGVAKNWNFWTCWTCEVVRASKPFGWPRFKKFVIKWWSFEEVRARQGQSKQTPEDSETQVKGWHRTYPKRKTRFIPTWMRKR